MFANSIILEKLETCLRWFESLSKSELIVKVCFKWEDAKCRKLWITDPNRFLIKKKSKCPLELKKYNLKKEENPRVQIQLTLMYDDDHLT